MSLGLSNNNDDAALIDSYFLPGGILDPDEEEEEEEEADDDDDDDDKPLTAGISPSWPLAISRVPSNPWCNQNETPGTATRHGNPSQAHEVQGQTVQDTGRLYSSQQAKEISGNPLHHLKPPPGYQIYQETYFVFPATTHAPESHLHNTHAQSDTTGSQHHPEESQRSRLNPSSPGPIDVPRWAWHDRTIRRPGRHTVETTLVPSSQHLSNTCHDHNGEYLHQHHHNNHNHQVVVGGHHEAGHCEFQGLGISKSYSYRGSREQSDTLGDGTDHQSRHSAISSYDGSLSDLLKVVSSERATSMEGSDFQMNEEDVQNNNNHEDEHDEDEEDYDDDDDDGAEADDIDDSSDEELPFPLEEFAFVHNFSKEDPDSMISSLSTSSSSSLDAHDSHVGLDENEYQQSIHDDDLLDVNRPRADPDSAVAVILDFSDTVEGNETIQTSSNDNDENENEHECTSLDTNKRSEAQNHLLLSETAEIAVAFGEFPVAMSEAQSIHSSQSSSKECHSNETAAPNLFSRFKVWSNNFQEYLVWMDDLHQAVAMVLTTTWGLVSLFTYWGMKFLLIASLLLIQGWKSAFFQLIEEPQVTVSYAIFYFMPSFCSLLRGFFITPHWTPHFLTPLAVWSLCTHIPAGPLSLDNFTVSGYMRQIIHRHNYSPPEPRSRDERASNTILCVLRFFLPLFFFADGFSTEFGTTLGVSGSSRLTTAFMMSLVRKSLVSSPVGWVSWAIQVLLVTHHHSSPLVDAFVLMAGLSSIRLIRYLDALRASNKRKQGKEH